MHFDYLNNPETEYLIGQIRLRAETDAGALLAECEEASQYAGAFLVSIVAQKTKIDAQIGQTVSICAADLRRMAGEIPLPDSVFSNAVDASAFSLVCQAFLLVEGHVHALRAALDRLNEIRQSLHYACERAAHMLCFLHMAKCACGEHAETLAAHCTVADNGVRALEASLRGIAAEQERLMELLSKRLPRLLEQLRTDADLDRKGTHLRVLAVRERMGELAFLLEESKIVEK